MINYHEILRLLDLGYTQRGISRNLHCSRDTVRVVHYLWNRPDRNEAILEEHGISVVID